jgi:hypothetical protein
MALSISNIYMLKYGAGHQRTADTPAGGGRAGTPAGGGQADTPAGGGQVGAILRMGIYAYAMGEGELWREPQRGGRVQVSTPRTPKKSLGGGEVTNITPKKGYEHCLLRWPVDAKKKLRLSRRRPAMLDIRSFCLGI